MDIGLWGHASIRYSFGILQANGAWTARKLSLMDKTYPGVEDGSYFKGQYYVVDCLGNVFVYEIDENPNNVQMRLVAPEIPEEQLFSPEIQVRAPYLVESATRPCYWFSFY